MIPVMIDCETIIADLKADGWLDAKIEIACGLGQGYIAQLRAGHIREPAYTKAARLYNFWLDRQQHLQTRIMSVTT